MLSPVSEPTYSERSYRFRPGRSTGQAVKQAQAYIGDGKRWVVDLDLEKFFDRVNHDVLMLRVARRVGDERVLKLIRRFLEAGMLQDGIDTARTKGTPQGGPLSPLLSNILLTDHDLDRERRRLAFRRYADDRNIYVRSRVAGDRGGCVGSGLSSRRSCACGATRRRARWRGRDRSLGHTIEELNPLRRGWIGYLKHTQGRRVLETLAEWLRRWRGRPVGVG